MKTRTRTAFSLPRRRVLGAMVAPLVAPTVVAAQSGSAVRVRTTSTPRFQIGVPEKDWRLLPGGVCTYAAVAHKDNAGAIVIEHEVLQIALTAEEIDKNFADLELTTIREREPNGGAFTAALGQVGRRRAVTIDYQRRGVSGNERVRVFVIVQGQHLYRLVCVAPTGQFVRFEPTFLAVCSSFAPIDAAPASAGR